MRKILYIILAVSLLTGCKQETVLITEPADYVTTMVGTLSEHSFSTGNTYPAIALPWGMNFWTPVTGKMGDGWAYRYDAHQIRGFEQTHQPSPWINDYGQFAIMPVRDAAMVDQDARASWFSHHSETARPYYYQVYLADHDINAEIAAKKSDAKYDLERGIRALYSVINLPTYTTDGQPAFARFAPYFSSDSGIDERDKVIRQDPVYNWHEDWKGTFYSDMSEMDIVIEGGSDAAQASAQAARIIKDHINNIIMAKTREEAIALYEKALKEFEAYGISAWEAEINRQIHEKRDKLNG